MRGLKGRRVILTGGGSGIGRATAMRLAEEGSIVGIFDVNDAGAQETVEACKKHSQAAAYKVDIGDFEQVKAAVEKFEKEFGPTELLANVAGWDTPGNFLDSDRAIWDKIIRINLYGPLNMHYAVVPGFKARRFGRVVNVSSDAGRVGSSGEAVYSACKGGIVSFTKTMARELSRASITLNTVCPGPTDTPLFGTFIEQKPALADALGKAIPLGRLGQVADYPGMIAFLLSDDAAFITGQTVSVSGGLTMQG